MPLSKEVAMPATPPVAMGETAIAAIKQYFAKAIGYEKAVLKDKDPEDLHQMRVNMRRLRTALQVFAPAIALPPAAQEAAVAKVARRLGALRDLDVTAALLAEQYLPDLPAPEGRCLKKALKSLGKKRQRTYKRVKATLKGDRYRELKKALNAWGNTPSCTVTASLPLETMLPDLTLPLVSQLWLHPGWLIATEMVAGQPRPQAQLEAAVIDRCVTESSPILHSLRKQVKRVRYQLRLVSPHYGDRLKEDLARLQALQETLGSLQDTWVLADFLAQAQPQWETQLPTLKALLMDSRQRAWTQWQALQAHYLDPQHRDALRQVLMAPGESSPQGGSGDAVKAKGSKTRSPKTRRTKTRTAAKGKTRTVASSASDPATDTDQSSEPTNSPSPAQKKTRRTTRRRQAADNPPQE
jgi:CHAD domain-containing protein